MMDETKECGSHSIRVSVPPGQAVFADAVPGGVIANAAGYRI